jgi:hypothetical protein
MSERTLKVSNSVRKNTNGHPIKPDENSAEAKLSEYLVPQDWLISKNKKQ